MTEMLPDVAGVRVGRGAALLRPPLRRRRLRDGHGAGRVARPPVRGLRLRLGRRQRLRRRQAARRRLDDRSPTRQESAPIFFILISFAKKKLFDPYLVPKG